MNLFIAIGRLGRDPEGKIYTKSDGTEVEIATYSLAITSGYGRYKETTWVNCDCYGGLAKNACKYLHKGDMIAIQGKLKINNFENKQGNKVTMTKIIVEKQTFLPKQTATENPEDEYIPDAVDGNANPSAAPNDDFMDIPDGIEKDLPFR